MLRDPRFLLVFFLTEPFHCKILAIFRLAGTIRDFHLLTLARISTLELQQVPRRYATGVIGTHQKIRHYDGCIVNNLRFLFSPKVLQQKMEKDPVFGTNSRCLMVKRSH